MGRKKKYNHESKPYWTNSSIYFADFELDGELVKPGTMLKIKGYREPIRFIRFVCNSKLETEWIDGMSETGWISVRPNKVVKRVIKRSRAKKE